MNYLVEGFNNLDEALTEDPGIWWFLAPLLILWFASQIYFGEYKKEKISFAGAFSSGLSFTWINIATLRILFMVEPDDFWIRFYILIVFFLYGLFLVYNSFFHKVSRESLWMMASPNTIYPLSIAVILFGQGHLKITLSAVSALLIIFSLIWLFLFFLKKKFLGLRGQVEAIKAGELPEELEEEKSKALSH